VEQFTVQLLGEFAVRQDGRSIDLPPACQRLVALLALKRRPVHRLWACATLWPHVPTRRAVASLRSAMWRLRPAGADPLLSTDPQYIRLAPEVTVDWHQSVDGIERLLGGEIEPATVADVLAHLRSGELLDRWTEPWVSRDRSAYHELRMTTFEALGHGADKHAHHVGGPIRCGHPERTVGRPRP
jgi:DNA-binding SARP family transcriptional activator